MHGTGCFIRRKLIFDTQCFQGVQHMADIIAIQQISQAGRSMASAASNNARLETLLDPGRLTVPSTRAIGSRVRVFIIFLLQRKILIVRAMSNAHAFRIK